MLAVIASFSGLGATRRALDGRFRACDGEIGDRDELLQIGALAHFAANLGLFLRDAGENLTHLSAFFAAIFIHRHNHSLRGVAQN